MSEKRVPPVILLISKVEHGAARTCRYVLLILLLPILVRALYSIRGDPADLLVRAGGGGSGGSHCTHCAHFLV